MWVWVWVWVCVRVCVCAPSYHDVKEGLYPGVVPDLGTFQALLVAVARSNSGAGNVSTALTLFRDMVSVDEEGNRLYPDAEPNVCVAVVAWVAGGGALVCGYGVVCGCPPRHYHPLTARV